jgi:hypothetical protein
MSLRSRSRWIAAATAVAIPALVLSTACSTDKAAGPASVASSDTVALDESNVNLVEWWVSIQNSDSGYYAFPGDDDGNYVETDLDNNGDFDNYRVLMQYALPKLAGKGVVDSAKMYNYACGNSGTFSDSIVVDHVNWGAAYKDSASYGSEIVQANIGTLVRDTTSGWKSLNITSSVQADYAAKRANTQYRIEWIYSAMPLGSQWVEFTGSYCNNSESGAGQGYLVIWSH